MTTSEAWEGVDVLIPADVHRRRQDAIHAARLDLAASIAALPTSPLDGQLSEVLADADQEDGRAWVARVIGALKSGAHDGTV